jgi:hypothetical protein
MFPEEFKSQSDEKPTHLLLNGGKLTVLQDREREFIQKYAKALVNKEKQYVVECRPSIFKFMIDLDIKEPEGSPEWTKERFIDLASTIQKTVYEFYEIDMNVICLAAPPKAITSKKVKYTKTGIHLIWPRHFTNTSDALLLRQGILHRIKEKYGERHSENPWEDVFDERIYTSNGYRMVGSDKFTRGSPEGREYWPMFVIDSEGNSRDAYFERISKDMEALVLDTSIRFVPVKVSIPITRVPEWLVVDEETTQKIKKKVSSKVSRMDICTKEYSALVDFMREKLPIIYRNQNIKSIQRYPDDNILIITDSRHCLNLGREHNSCGIYFFATEKGVYQKCLCPCINMKDRIFGYCKDYTSSCFEFSDELREMLFKKKKTALKKTKSDLNLSSTQSTNKFKKHLSNFCDDIFNTIMEKKN